MKRNHKLKIALFFILVLSIILIGCGKNDYSDNISEPSSTEASTNEMMINDDELNTNVEDDNSEIIILYTNDVHSYIDNVVKDDDGNIIGDGLRFSKIAAMVNDMREDGKNVLLVDAGDELQGNIYGSMDEGETIIKLMTATGYQLATPGNHDFDYGVLNLLKLVEACDYPYVTCNFHSTDSDEIIFSPSHIFELDGKKVAFIGVTTPETLTSSTPVYFQNEKGEFIYTIDGLRNYKDLYSSVQNAIDDVKDDVDYIIGIGHLGVDMDSAKKGWDSKSVIENVSGLNAFIDGHSHTIMESEIIKDRDGKEVVLTQAGCYLNSVGMMTISSDGIINTKLIDDYEREDEDVALLEKAWMDTIDSQMGKKIAVLENTLFINNPDIDNQRLIRSREMNLGDFTADSVYWYFNEKLGIGCDVALVNGGGVRNTIEAGDINLLSAKQVQPFGNMICLISATGQQIIDALEMGVTYAGGWNDELDSPAENGGFLHVAGLSYTIDSTIPSSVILDDNGMFVNVDGEYRVKDVKIYNKETGIYEPIETEKYYKLGGINYILRNNGNGLTMFNSDELTVDYVGQDYIIFSEYIKNFETDGKYPVVNTANSPLSNYAGYLLDYDNPYGAGRISIITE